MATNTPQNPGDQVPPSVPGAGEAVCDHCKGTGKVIEGIGGG